MYVKAKQKIMKEMIPNRMKIVCRTKYLAIMRVSKNNFITQISLILAFGMLVFGLTSCYEERELGDVTTQIRELDEFYGLDLDGIGNAEIISSTEYKVEVRTHINLLDDVITTVEGGILKIDLIGNHKKIDVLEYRVYVPYCNYVKLDGVGNIHCIDGFTSQSLKIIHSGVGDIKLLNINVDKLDAELEDVGNIQLSGSSIEEYIILDGVGNYEAFDLSTDSAEVLHDGVGDVKITVNDHLKVNVKGVGKVYYKGDPVVDADVSRTGGLIKVD